MSFIKPPTAIAELPHTQTGLVDLDPAWLNVDANRFQFKSGGDEFGVTERLHGVSRFDTQLCGIVVVWQDKEGHLFIADGHQRMGLARRARANGQTDGIFLPARIYKESEGYSVEDIKVIAAFKNIAEGTGSATDVARVIRQHGDLPSTIPPKSILVKQARGLAKLSDDVFGAVCMGTLAPEYGAAMAQALESCNLDEATRSKMEMAIFKAFCSPSSKPSNELEAHYIAKEVIRTGIAEGETTGNLFDFEEVDNILKERAEILAAAQNILQDEIRNTRSMVRDETTINGYIVGDGKLDKPRVQSRHDDLLVARAILEMGWKYREIGNPLSQSARRLNALKAKPDDHLEVQSLVTMLDNTLSLNARDLKAAKMKGEDTNGAITKIRANFAKQFLGEIQEFLVKSDLARTLRRSLGPQIQAIQGRHGEGPGLGL
jgi:hypothetical protein